MRENQERRFKSLQEATGPVPFNMTNDYLFRAVLQENNYVLCGLIRSLLHIPESDKLEAVVTNPIKLGESIADKEFRLDINVIINDEKCLNLEMQVENHLDWQLRSLSYLCRSYDQLKKGQGYRDIKPVIHIGFLDFSLFEEYPEFYAQYKMMNVKKHYVYSSNLDLRVVDLNKTDIATEEDKEYQIDYWANLFRAGTWEEIRMISEKNNYIKEASETIFQMTEDEIIRKRCYDRLDYYATIKDHEAEIAEKDKLIAEKDEALAEQRNALAEKDEALAEKNKVLQNQEVQIKALLEQIEELKGKNSII